MKPNRRQASKWLSAMAGSIVLAATVTGCSSMQQAADKGPAGPFETTRSAIHKWLSEGDSNSLIMLSSFLKERIVDDWPSQSEKFQIVSVRSPDDYKRAGHIPNAINIYWVEILSDQNLARLDSRKTQVLYCYYGHASMLCSTILNLLGYKSCSLDFGMMDWNLDAMVKEPWDKEADYEVDKGMRDVRETYPTPSLASKETGARSIVKEEAKRYFASEGSPIIRAAAVREIVDNWEEEAAEYQIVDVRSRRDYEKGHVPNAINIPLAEIAELRNLTKVDPNRMVIVYSENGQTGQMAATLLNLLGYRAVNMLFGMMDWNVAYVDWTARWDGAASYPITLEE
jgi:rhodanese-related sulfurtransferase